MDNECEFSNQMAVDVMFKVVNLKDGLSKEEASFMGRGHGHALMRFEWVEIIIRLGIAKFFESGVTQDPSNAVEMLCNNHILPHLHVAATHQRNDFRRDRLYNAPVDTLLKGNRRALEFVFHKRCALKPSRDVCMDMAEWISFLHSVGLVDDDFTKREARLCFTWSKMRVADEAKHEVSGTTLKFLDFLEALCRASELKSFPTDEQLRAGGYGNCVQFLRDPKRPPMDDAESDVGNSQGGLFMGNGRHLAERTQKLLLCMFAHVDSDVMVTGKVNLSKLMQIMNHK